MRADVRPTDVIVLDFDDGSVVRIGSGVAIVSFARAEGCFFVLSEGDNHLGTGLVEVSCMGCVCTFECMRTRPPLLLES